MDKAYDILEQYDRDGKLRELVNMDLDRMVRRFGLTYDEAEELQSLAGIYLDAELPQAARHMWA